MNKKADFNFTVALVLILAAGIILILISSGMIQWFKGYFIEESCQTSILKASELRVNVLSQSNTPILPNLDCPVQKVTIKLNDILDKDKKIDDNKFKRKIADEIYNCWDKIGKFKLMPYSFGTFTNKNMCLICTEIKFEESLLKKMQEINYKPMSLYKWMFENKVANSQKTYFDLIYNGTIIASSEPYKPLDEQFNQGILTSDFSDNFILVWHSLIVDKPLSNPGFNYFLPYFKVYWWQTIFIASPNYMTKNNVCDYIVN